MYFSRNTSVDCMSFVGSTMERIYTSSRLVHVYSFENMYNVLYMSINTFTLVHAHILCLIIYMYMYTYMYIYMYNYVYVCTYMYTVHVDVVYA